MTKKKRGKDMPLVTDTELLKRFWGDDNKLDTHDKFLRNYILLEGWKDKGKRNKFEQEAQDKIDNEDEQRDSEMDAYEHTYNFRFEDGPNS